MWLCGFEHGDWNAPEPVGVQGRPTTSTTVAKRVICMDVPVVSSCRSLLMMTKGRYKWCRLVNTLKDDRKTVERQVTWTAHFTIIKQGKIPNCQPRLRFFVTVNSIGDRFLKNISKVEIFSLRICHF